MQQKKYIMRSAQINVVTPTTEREAQSINHEDKSEWLQTRRESIA
jgi:hypothetical protein